MIVSNEVMDDYLFGEVLVVADVPANLRVVVELRDKHHVLQLWLLLGVDELEVFQGVAVVGEPKLPPAVHVVLGQAEQPGLIK